MITLLAAASGFTVHIMTRSILPIILLSIRFIIPIMLLLILMCTEMLTLAGIPRIIMVGDIFLLLPYDTELIKLRRRITPVLLYVIQEEEQLYQEEAEILPAEWFPEQEIMLQ
jgi:hypothetical protein